MKILRGLVFGAVCIFLTACGFHLRGYTALPALYEKVYLEGNPRSAVVTGVQRALRQSGANLVADPQAANAVLTIIDEQTGRRVLSVGNDGKVAEYEVFYSVSFTVETKPAEPTAQLSDASLSTPQTVRLTRDYVFDSAGVLASGEQEQTLRMEMQRDLVRLIMLRLQVLGKSKDQE